MPIKMKNGKPDMSHKDARKLYDKFLRENDDNPMKAHKQFGAVMESMKRRNKDKQKVK